MPKNLSHKLCLLLLIYVSIIGMSKQAQPCQSVQIDSYRYELDALVGVNIAPIPTYSDNQINFIEFSLCKLVDCVTNNQTLEKYTTYVKNTIGTVCHPHTSNITGPLVQSYKLINQKQPDKGVYFQYIPIFRANQSTFINGTKIINQTQFNITNQANTLNNARINLYCNSVEQKNTTCSVTKTNSTVAINQTHNVVTYRSYLSCDIYASQGCPKLAVNTFWEYLNRKSIIFAIFIWISAIFLFIFGYLAIRFTIFLYGVYVGSFFGVVFIAQNYSKFYFESDGLFIFTICLSVVLGILFGIVLLTLPKLGYVNIGIFVAAIFSLLLQNALLYLTGSLLAFYITFGVTALIMTVVSLMELRYFIIVCTSFTGAFWFVRPLGFFLPGYPNQLMGSKNLLISVKTPWHFYLYLVSIIILTILGTIIQRYINYRFGNLSKAGVSGSYYLQEQGSMRQKLKKIFQFKQIKDMIKAGKKQVLQLKDMITDKKNVEFSQQLGDQQDDNARYIQMEKMQKIQNKQRQKKPKQKIVFVAPQSKTAKAKSKKQRNYSDGSVQPDPVDVDDLQQISDADSTPVVKIKSKRK